MERHVFHLEEVRVVEHGTIHAALVGTFYVHIFISACGKCRLGHEVVEAVRILHLAHADDGTTYAWQHVGAHFREHARHVVQFVAVFQFVPAISALGQEFVVVFTLVVGDVE